MQLRDTQEYIVGFQGMCDRQPFQKYICSIFCFSVNECTNIFKRKYKGKELEQQNTPCEHFFSLPCQSRLFREERRLIMKPK